MSAKYYIRPRKEENPKRWQGPFDEEQLKDLAERRLFSRELHEYSEDKFYWIPARQIWSQLFPKTARTIAPQVPPVSSVMTSKPATSSSTSEPARTSDSSGQIRATETAAKTSEEWYYASNGRAEGPVSLEQIQKLAAKKRIQLTDLVWSPQFGDQWVEARMVAEIFPPVDLTAPQWPLRVSWLTVVGFAFGLIFATLFAFGGYLLFSRFRH